MPDPDPNVEAEDQEPEITHDGFVSDKQHAERIGVQHKKYRDEERGHVAATERANKAEAELRMLQAERSKVVIPDVPDKYSETYDQEVLERDEAIRKSAANDAEIQRQADETKRSEDARKTDADSAIKERIGVFDTNMVTHGLNPAETKTAADTVLGYGISETFEDILLEDPDGPLFVSYLAANPIELEELNGLSPLKLMTALNGDIRKKAALLKPKTSNAPDPPVTLSGGGAPELSESWERGAKYE